MRNTLTPPTVVLSLLTVIGCDGGGKEKPNFGASAGGGLPPAATEGQGEEESSDASSQGEGSGQGDSGQNDSDSNPESSGSGEAEGAKDDSGGGGDNSGGDDGEQPRFDVATWDDVGEPPGTEEIEFSYIWIANAQQGTVSKIDTRTLKEEGRYLTSDDAGGQPSRTSVGLSGDVVVLNRFGGAMKVRAQVERCEDKNGEDGIQTAVDENFLPWEQDDCVDWYVPMPYDSQRSVAWTSGELDPDTGEISNERVWVTGIDETAAEVDVMLLDGDTGETISSTSIPVPRFFYRYQYGGAVDQEDNLWWSTSMHFGGGALPDTLHRVAYDDLSETSWTAPVKHAYGMTYDRRGYIWLCGQTIQRFEISSETWETTTLAGEGSTPNWGGCMVDSKGLLWAPGTVSASGNDAILALDGSDLSLAHAYEIPKHSQGVSIDAEGYVWAVSSFWMSDGADAYRVDPETGAFDTFDGLVGAYTYSDMTGFALRAAQKPVE